MFCRRRVWAPGVLALTLALAACSTTDAAGPSATSPEGPPAVVSEDSPSPLHGTAVDPPLARPEQVLRDTNGQPFSLADRPEGELTVLFFGYTHCPDVCSTTMADLASARSRLPQSLQDRVAVAFVTEDPERDTPRALRAWLDGFDPAFVGVMGGNQATKEMLRQLYLPGTERMEQPKDPVKHPDHGGHHHEHGDYGIDHSGVVYAFGPGDSSVLYSGGTTPSQYAADFARLLDGSQP